MGKLLNEFGIKPKAIDYGENPKNERYRKIEEEHKLLDDKFSNVKRKNRGK